MDSAIDGISQRLDNWGLVQFMFKIYFFHDLDSKILPWLFFRSDMVPRKRSQLPYHVSTECYCRLAREKSSDQSGMQRLTR